MTEITEIDMNKYLVLKWDDIRAILKDSQQKELISISQTIHFERLERGKKQGTPQYLVLNMDDEIDLDYLRNQITFDEPIEQPNVQFKVRDVAGALVNAILKTKKE